ncbi:transposase [Streptosporangium sp. 'caverna']|uniref:transposase n=1 Tax=Streptosporangium sp. 'caverna' TaxID=2202249 RepID=UPI001EF7A939|nr:transposase [Streptosporangium sp. 'caverna']
MYGALRVADGTALTMTARNRNSDCYQQFLQQLQDANPGNGDIWVIADNLSSHNSATTRAWLAEHLRIRHAFIPIGACWINLQEAWWRIFRHHALAGVSFACRADIDHATRLATAQLNARARPWIWGRSPPVPRRLRRQFSYSF